MVSLSQRSSLPKTHCNAPRTIKKNRRTSDDETTSSKSATRCCYVPLTSRSPLAASDQQTNCVLSTLALSHFWNSTHQSPSASNCLHSTRSTTSSMSTPSAITCNPQKHLAPESQHHQIRWRRRARGGRNFKVSFLSQATSILGRMEGYGREADEWIPLSNLDNSTDMVKASKQQHGLIF